MSVLQIDTAEVFEPLLADARYKAAFGGRGSGKSHFFAGDIVDHAIRRPGLRALCLREVQNSLAESSKKLIEDKIETFGVRRHFDIQAEAIRTPGDGLIMFRGMWGRSAVNVKSMEGVDIVWGDEANRLSQRSLDILRPTIRKPGSQLWFSWNPESPEDPIDALFRGAHPPSNSAIVEAHYWHNPWLTAELIAEIEEDLRRDPDKHANVWLGEYLRISAAQVFRGRWSVADFDEPPDMRPYYGADWGFANDPTTLIRCYVVDGCLYITHEAYAVGVEIDETPALFDSVPGARSWPIRADNSRPETISYIGRQGFRISAADKWPGSVEDGIAHLKGFRKIVIHPRCVNTAREFRLYSYKTDRQTGDVLPILVDAHNHAIDAIRYSLDGVIQGRRPMRITKDILRKSGTRAH